MTLLLISFSARLKSVNVPTISEQVGTVSFFRSTFSGRILFCTHGEPYSWLVVLQRLLLAALVKVVSPDMFYLQLKILRNLFFCCINSHHLQKRNNSFQLYALGDIITMEQNRKMAFFQHDDPSEELTQRNLQSPRSSLSVQSEIIQKLQRENLYLKNQLFNLIQNSGAYDMYLPKEALLHQNVVKNDHGFTYTCHQQQKVMEGFHHKEQHYQPEYSHRPECFSPRVQSFNYSNNLQSVNRPRSPQFQRDFCRRLVLNPNQLNRRTSKISEYANTVRTTPSKQTPYDSAIITTNPSPQKHKSHFNDMRGCLQAKEKVNMLKRNTKSPSFLKNKHVFKENIRESLSGVMKNQLSAAKSLEKQNEVNRNAQIYAAKIGNHPTKHQNEATQTYQNRNVQRRKSKTFTIQFSEGDSCLSIERRLREILYEPIIMKTEGNE